MHVLDRLEADAWAAVGAHGLGLGPLGSPGLLFLLLPQLLRDRVVNPLVGFRNRRDDLPKLRLVLQAEKE